jgi:glutamyl-Q tRNA(Asp) synthetase
MAQPTPCAADRRLTKTNGSWRDIRDAILARKEFPTSYHLASVHDDALQGVTHVIRGEDLREAAHLHVLLQKLMGWPTPAYRHHPLITGADGKRLAKRDQAVTLQSLRSAGETESSIRARLLLGSP